MELLKKYEPDQWFIGFLRILMGWTFLWAFLDKLFGLGYNTESDGAYIKKLLEGEDAASPTAGYLKFATNPDGPFADFFQNTLGKDFLDINDILFMSMLLVAGLGLLLGTWTRIAGISGAIFMFSVWLSVIPSDPDAGFLEHNPLTDEHIIQFFLLLFLVVSSSGKYLGLADIWKNQIESFNVPPIMKDCLI